MVAAHMAEVEAAMAAADHGLSMYRQKLAAASATEWGNPAPAPKPTMLNDEDGIGMGPVQVGAQAPLSS